MKLHGHNLESLYKDVPMRLLPVEYLPDDYKGPNAGTEKEIIGDNRQTLFIVIISLATIHRVLKKGATLFLPVTLRNANRFSKFFHHHTLQ